MHLKLIIGVVISSSLISCEEPLEQTFAYWSYMSHVDEYNTLRNTTDARVDTGLTDQRALRDLTYQMILSVEEIERTLLDSVGQEDFRAVRNGQIPDMHKLLDYKVSSDMLIGDEPGRPSTGPHSAEALKKQLDNHIIELTRLSGLEPSMLRTILRTDDVHAPDGILTFWSTGTFYHMPLISALDELNSIKIKLVLLELVAVSVFSAKPSSTSNAARP